MLHWQMLHWHATLANATLANDTLSSGLSMILKRLYVITSCEIEMFGLSPV